MARGATQLEGSYDSLSDDELMARAAQGDEQAFEVVHARHRERIFRIVYRCVGQRQVAEDVTQETFLRVFRHLRRYRPMGQTAAWVTRIAVNLSRNALRRRREQVVGEDPSGEGGGSMLERVADTAAGPAERAASSESEARVQASIDELPVEYREVLVLCSLEGFSYREAAQVLKISEQLVGVRLFRGRHMLRFLLQRSGVMSCDQGGTV